MFFIFTSNIPIENSNVVNYAVSYIVNYVSNYVVNHVV